MSGARAAVPFLSGSFSKPPLLGWLLAACAGVPPEVRLGAEFTLPIHQAVRIDTTGWGLRFEAVPEDSRCPADVVCVWAGHARVQLRLRNDETEHSVVLNTTTEPRQATVAGFELLLHGLTPLPRSGKPVPPGDYRARLEVRRLPAPL